MKFEDSYFEDEVRDGFYIPSMVKRAWAAELEVLSEIDRICKKYDIPYFADWGSLLGAVRHGGFIPWDDDMDITMKRADYKRFMGVAKEELPEGFEAYNYRENEDYWGFVARVVGKRRICFEEDHLRKFHGFPYITGVDIFVLDYVSDDVKKEADRVTIANYILAVADEMAAGKIKGAEAEKYLQKVEDLCKVKLNREQNMNQLRTQLYILVEEQFEKFKETESSYLTRMMPDGLMKWADGTWGNPNLRIPKRHYDDMLWMPYENISIPVPMAYDEMLSRRYGDYMRIVRDSGGHDYPFFEIQKKQLEEVMGFEMPAYKFSSEHMVRGKQEREKIDESRTLKGISKVYKENLSHNIKDIMKYRDNMQQKNQCYLLEEYSQILIASQQEAIEYATCIEQCKGEDHVTVKLLEIFCEEIYQLYEMVSNGQMGESHLDQLADIFDRIIDSIQKDIIERREVVFLPYQARYWNAIESVYKAAMEDENCDVYVIPIPYYYKEYDGTLRNRKYEGEAFPDGIEITMYQEFDFEMHCPETIITQNPYDEWDSTVSVEKFFYSNNIRRYTDQLVYIPYFKVYEFTKDDYREYHNMQYYVTVPGVINADKVIVQSENMRELYIEKLTEFAGDDTRPVWEAKIVGIENTIEEYEDKDICDSISDEWRVRARKEDGTYKKMVAFYVTFSSLLQHKEHLIEKLRHVLEIFYDSRQDIILLWKENPMIYQSKDYIGIQLWEEYMQLQNQYIRYDNVIYIQSTDVVDASEENILNKKIAAVCDAYYGDSGKLAQMIQMQEKPVMIMNWKMDEM